MPAFASPKSLLQQAKSALTNARSPKPPKPDGVATFVGMAAQYGLVKPGSLVWKTGPSERKALFIHAAHCSVLDNVAFAACGIYYLQNPRNFDLARGIKEVFLDAKIVIKGAKASDFAINLDRPTYQELDRMLTWQGYGDVAGALEKAAQGLTNSMHASHGDTLAQLKEKPSNTSFGPGVLKTLAAKLWEGRWDQSDLQKAGLQ